MIDTPVISFDILPTVLDATRSLSDNHDFDGSSLLPLLTGRTTAHHKTLYWSKGKEDEWAVRRDDWKLHQKRGTMELVNLVDDLSETKNLAKSYPEKVKELTLAFNEWIEQMPDPITGGEKRVASRSLAVHKQTNQPQTERQKKRTSIRAEKQKNREAQQKFRKAKERGESATARDYGTSIGNARPNVMFIVCDDLNTHVSTSGYPHIRTSAFDRLAAAGMTFRRAYCQYPVCGPSRASFLHGLYPQSTGVLNNRSDIRDLRPESVSMPQLFKDSGYWTGAVGKVFHLPINDPGDVAWHAVQRFENDEMPSVIPIRKAFEEEHGAIEKSGKDRRLWRQKYVRIAKQTRGQEPGYGPSGLRNDQHKDGKNVRQIASWLTENAHEDKPFFMACGIQKPHVPFLAPDKYFDMYPQAGLKFSPARADFWEQAPRIAMVKRYTSFGFELGVENDSLRREYMQAYHACISFVDAQIDLVLDALKQTGHWDDTIVVLTSDHGYQLGEHFMWGKVTLFEACDRVPLIIRVPGRTKAESLSDGLVELVDLFPTLAELCGLEIPDNLQGQSLVSMLSDPTMPGKDVAYTVVSRAAHLGKAIRTNQWRYAKWPTGEELYDLTNDPAEETNLAVGEKHAEVLKRLRKRLATMDAKASSQRVTQSAPAKNE